MDNVTEKKKQSYVFDRKLTDEEIEQLIENYDYDPKYLDPDYDDGGTELEPVWDKFLQRLQSGHCTRTGTT